ncbi:hypothetical protein AX14_008777 [Amanita brunnescens Koide BX004]|nr:hypothetical protein AX14_008777 [Amanita brunnescens Koide BX004]
MPPLPLADAKSVQQPGIKAVVSKEGTNATLCTPLHMASPMTPRCSAPVSTKSASFLCLKKDKSNLTVPMEVKALQPVEAKDADTCSTSTDRSAPMTSAAARALPSPSTPVLSRHSAPTRLPNDEHKPLVEVVAVQRKSGVISTKEAASGKGTYQMTETCTKAPDTLQRSGDFSSTDRSKSVETTQLKRAVEDNGCLVECPEDGRNNLLECPNKMQGLVIEQAHSSLLSDEMGERRLSRDPVIDKINKKDRTKPLPESLVVPSSLPIPSSASMPQMDVPRLVSNEPTPMPTGIQQGPISKGEEMSVHKHLPEAAVAPALPVHLPATPRQAATLRQPLDEGLPPIEVTPKRHDLCVVNTKHLSSDTHSSKVESARKQSESVKSPSFESEGRYLERAMAYVRERISRRAFACDALVPRAQKKPPDKTVDSETAG